MVEREMITMIVDTLPVFYYEKLVGYMPSSFADLVFAGERIEVGLKRGKFDYIAPASTSNRRFGESGAKKKERDAHAVTLAPTWPKLQQTPHNKRHQLNHKGPPLKTQLLHNLSPPTAPIRAQAPIREGIFQ